MTAASSSSIDTPMTCSPAAPYRRCQREKTGISSIQGAHQVAQKFSSTTLPLNWSSRSGRPDRSVRVKSGAMLFSRPAGSAAPPAANIRIERQAQIAAAPSTRRSGGMNLSAFGHWIALVNPVSAEIFGDVQGFDIEKAELLQRQAAIDAEAATDGWYALLTNLDATETAAAVLLRYKAQEAVERRYGNLKGPLAVAPMFLNSNRRIAALITVISLALLVFCLIEREARRNLAPETKLDGLYNRQPARPTGRLILTALAGLQLIPATATSPAQITRPQISGSWWGARRVTWGSFVRSEE